MTSPTPAPFVAGVKVARERIVARKDEDRETFLCKRGLSKSETAKVIAAVLPEEGRPPESVFDFVQGITAVARAKPHQDAPGIGRQGQGAVRSRRVTCAGCGA